MVNMSAMFNQDAHKGFVFIVFTRSKCDAQTDACTNRWMDTQTDGQNHRSVPSAMQCAGIKFSQYISS